MIKAVIFDMDGTLVNTLDIAFESYKEFFSKNDIKVTEEELNSIVTGSWQKAVPILFKERKKEFPPGKINELLEIYTRKIVTSKTLPHAIDVLEQIHDKAIMILATFSLMPQTNTILKKNDLEKYFDMIFTQDGYRDNKKTENKKYEDKKDQIKDILAQLKLKPEECIHIEDTHYGLESGQHNDVFTIGVRHYFDDLKADVVVDNLDQVKEIILKKLNEGK